VEIEVIKEVPIEIVKEVVVERKLDLSSLASVMTNVKTVETKGKPKVVSTKKGEAKKKKTHAKKSEAKKKSSSKTKTTKKSAAKNSQTKSKTKSTPNRVSKKSTRGSSKANIRKDDLTKIEGIGPAIQKLLYAKRITTWTRLSKTKIAILRKLLADGGSRFTMHNPETWAKQAGMAASGDWEKLRKWQDKHRG